MKKKHLEIGILVAVLLVLAVFLGTFFGLRSKSSSEHVYKRAAVATDAGQCSIVGR